MGKAAWEGSSKGIRGKCVVDTRGELVEAIGEGLRQSQQPILVEEFIAGYELTVGIVGNGEPGFLEVMGVVPVEPTERFVYSLEVKRDFRRRGRYEYPARLSAPELRAVAQSARTAL